ncbi:MAG: glutaredoxin domain-containing protein [Candidatus Brocadiaceae bacterium]
MAAHKLKVYCTPFCPKCNELLAYLSKKKADFVSYDIDKDDNARKEVVKIVGTDDVESLDKLPIVVAGEKVLYGFNRKEIDKCLK